MTTTDAPIATEATIKAYAAAEKAGSRYMQLGQFADAIGVSRPTISNWRARYDDFPAPALICGTVELFSRATMRKYAASLNYSVDGI